MCILFNVAFLMYKLTYKLHCKHFYNQKKKQ